MVFEFVVFGIVLLAAGYWATLFVIGRQDDVLHGKFVEREADAEPRHRAMSRVRPRT